MSPHLHILHAIHTKFWEFPRMLPGIKSSAPTKKKSEAVTPIVWKACHKTFKRRQKKIFMNIRRPFKDLSAPKIKKRQTSSCYFLVKFTCDRGLIAGSGFMIQEFIHSVMNLVQRKNLGGLVIKCKAMPFFTFI